ncbi:pentapeptide repeat-containing protein [Dehalobacter restrictus]|jgi:uncharacterized protein YjbI with pentapeptide repeats|uniref:Pentapeptide repeat-containing protein n=1 Tax=Dehalobacter restrictus (strain DSM 9455 / PER-K23) TaxID=871738 RepID=A0ABM5P497_DEHRP|nr:pentapeptide repeat-containing protein [Dehalobacter restrictus]AHF09360.1 hypothetical protein DEHRE_04105 [Dehalobacter restrictus DSM 9455]
MQNNQFYATRPIFDNELEPATLARENITDEAMFSYVEVSDCTLDHIEADRIMFKQVVFQKVMFTEAIFRYADLMNVRFQNCDLSNADFSEAILHRVEFINCKLIGINLSEATLRDVTFENCNCQYAFFGYANGKQNEDYRLRHSMRIGGKQR